MDDGRIQFSQIMLFDGANALKAMGILRIDATEQEMLVAVAKVYRAMRAAEPEIIKPAKILWGRDV